LVQASEMVKILTKMATESWIFITPHVFSPGKTLCVLKIFLNFWICPCIKALWHTQIYVSEFDEAIEDTMYKLVKIIIITFLDDGFILIADIELCTKQLSEINLPLNWDGSSIILVIKTKRTGKK
jgi:hypothetical protein